VRRWVLDPLWPLLALVLVAALLVTALLGAVTWPVTRRARVARLARFYGLARDPDRSALARWLARKDDAWIARYAKALARPPAWYLDRARPPRRE